MLKGPVGILAPCAQVGAGKTHVGKALAVAFLRAQGDFVNVICGAHKPEQIEADAPAADVELSSETVADIRKRLAALDAEFE